MCLQGDVRSHADYVKSRPPAWEVNALRTLLEVLESSPGVAQPGFNLHIAHLSDTSSLPFLAEAKTKGPTLRLEMIQLQTRRLQSLRGYLISQICLSQICGCDCNTGNSLYC